MANSDKYGAARIARQEHIDKILKSESGKKVVVAGPGTGKTYLFKEILAGKKNTLTLSFVNTLVDDLSLELCGLSEVRTLHSYARNALAVATNSKVILFPKLSYVIQDDASLLLGADIDFDEIFQNRHDKNEHINFYQERQIYYMHHGYADVIFAAVNYFEAHKDQMPVYDQVLVDEFQDFNLLEVSLINLLAEKSPILLAGDDDQALYDFKHASAQYIRNFHGGAGSAYAAFNLPYCSRCTRTIIDATNDLIKSAQKQGLLKGRIQKPYRYFDNEEKDVESTKFSRIGYQKTYYANQIPWFIETEIQKMAVEVRSTFSVLVIAPTSTQCRDLTSALRKKGFKSVSYTERGAVNPTLMEGLKLILEDKNSNLGWRIIARHMLKEVAFVKVLKSAQTNTPFTDFLDKAFKVRVLNIVKKLRQLRDGSIDKGSLPELFLSVEIDPNEEAQSMLQRRLDSGGYNYGMAAVRNLPIRVTSIQSSKGLAADLVFITYFDDRYFIRSKDKSVITDLEVCNLIVALTRARRKVVLVSSTLKDPIFMSWIDKSRIEVL